VVVNLSGCKFEWQVNPAVTVTNLDEEGEAELPLPITLLA
jgi:hypothetical protein